MKKSLFLMAAASAIMLTACTSESDVLQSATKQEAPKAIGFDVYTQNVTNATRATAGRTGAMTTSTLKENSSNGGGFGVFGFYTDNAVYSASATPNFMYNQMVLWNETNQGWYYDPLKYWPNETNKDSQSSPAFSEEESGTPGAGTTTDYLTFFAYAPYVPAVGAEGITAMTPNSKTGDPEITYKADMSAGNLVADNQVDLLWGVAPSGDLTYTAVSGATINKKEGLPLIDMVKPNVNTNMKFLFQHALARLGITAVAAIDQVSAGGKLDPNTKITIKQIKLTGKFGETGVLNLNNTAAGAKVANWTTLNDVTLASNPTIGSVTEKSFVIDGTQIDEQLRYQLASGSYPTNMDKQTCVGVTTTKANVIAPSSKYFSPVVNPIYSPYKKYYTTAAHDVEAHASYTVASGKVYFHYDASNSKYVKHAESTTITAPDYGTAVQYYILTATEYTASAGCPDLTATYYTVDGSGNYTEATPTWSGDTKYYILDLTPFDVPYTYADGTYYTADNNYYMLIPTNNFERSTSITSDDDLKALRTVKVQIEYYITTEDGALASGRAQTRNVIEKTVVFPSLANGKSYNLNLVLGLTSVKMEAEVADWDVINVNADLPQNTGE